MATNRRKPVIGLLGGMGSGKSTVARQFEKLGCGIVDSDRLTREALDEPAVRKQLVEWWGPGVVDASGHVDRAVVGRIVFRRADQLALLEGLIHPLVNAGRERLRRRYQNDPGIVAIVEDTPLLLEKGLGPECDVLVYVDASREIRLGRLAKTRGWAEAELARREIHQMPLDTKAARADYVVENNAGEEESFQHVRRVLSQILEHPRPC